MQISATDIIRADYHLHTHHSGDSEAPMESIIESAISKGLSEICFTEHNDMDFPVTKDVPAGTFDLDTDSYYKEYLYYKEKYQNEISIKFGVELGLKPELAERLRDYVKSYPFDFVIGSIHLVDNKDPYYASFWEGQKESDVIRRYFEYTVECLEAFDDFDVLGHLDYIVRYTPSNGAGYSYEAYKDLIDKILELLIKKDIGLDLNTKSLFKGSDVSNPNTDILKRYIQLGGKVITFGSDAHEASAVAGGFDKAKDIALACGFTNHCTYNKRLREH